MPAPTNISAATATEIASLPASITQNVLDAGTAYTVWYKYVATFTGVVGFFAFGNITNYSPTTVVWTDNGVGGQTTLLGGFYANNKPIQVPVISGRTYYFQIVRNSPTASPADLSIEVEAASNVVFPAGSILVNDDTGGYSDIEGGNFPIAILSAVNNDDYNVLKFYYRDGSDNYYAAGESGDIIRSTGRFLLENIDDTVKLYDKDFVLIATIARTTAGATDLIRTCQPLSKFYSGNPTTGVTPATVQVINNDGTLGTLYTFPVSGLRAIAPNNDGSIIYNIGQASTGTVIKRYITASGTQDAVNLADLGVLGSSLLVLDDDTILAAYRSGGTTYVKQFQPDGTLLNTYNIQGSVRAVEPRLAYALDDPDSFWVWVHPDVSPFISRFKNVRISDGSVLAEVDHIEYEGGTYQGAATLTPTARFGVSYSCPFLILNAPTSEPPEPEVANPGSGIYVIVPGKRNDTLWVDFNASSSENVKIPNPFVKTGLLGE